jgi:hypothetical protein
MSFRPGAALIRVFLEVDALIGVFAGGGNCLHAVDAFVEVHRPRARLEQVSVHVCFQQNPRCLLPSRREVLQQFLRSLIQVFPVLLLLLGGIDRMLGSTDPNKQLCSRVVDSEDESPDVNG